MNKSRVALFLHTLLQEFAWKTVDKSTMKRARNHGTVNPIQADENNYGDVPTAIWLKCSRERFYILIRLIHGIYSINYNSHNEHSVYTTNVYVGIIMSHCLIVFIHGSFFEIMTPL